MFFGNFYLLGGNLDFCHGIGNEFIHGDFMQVTCQDIGRPFVFLCHDYDIGFFVFGNADWFALTVSIY